MSQKFYTNLINPNLISSSGSDGAVTNPLTSNIDCAGFSLLNVASPSNSGDAVNLGYLQGVLPPSDALTNPLTQNLDLNSHELTNVTGILVKDSVDSLNSYWITCENGGIVTSSTTDSSDTKLFICINESAGKPSYTDFRGTGCTNMGTVGFSGGGTITNSNSSFVFNQPINLGNNLIQTVQALSFGVSNSHSINVNDGVLQIDSDAILTSANAGTYIDSAISSLGYFKSGSQPLNMDNYPIQNILNIQFPNPANANLPHSIEVSSANKIQIDGYDAITSGNLGSYSGWSSGIAQDTIAMNGHDLQGITTLTFSDSSILSVSGGDLQYKGSNVLTEANAPSVNIINPFYSYSQKVSSTSPLALYVNITGSDASYFFSGTITGLQSCTTFDCFIYPDGSGGMTVGTPNIQNVGDTNTDFSDLTITATTSQITLTCEKLDVVAPLYDSCQVVYQVIQNNYQE